MVSVVTIVKNDKENISKTMLSVLNQTYENMEYIIQNGKSNDGTTEIIEHIKSLYITKNIFHINEPDFGIYNAMNRAVNYCKGDWIIFMNSGDVFYDKNVLHAIFETKCYPNTGVLYGDALVSDGKTMAIWKADINLVKIKMPFCHQACFIRRYLLVKYPFDEQYKIGADYSNILDLYIKNIQFENIGKIVSIYDLNGISSTQYVLRYREKESVKKKHGLPSKNLFNKFICIMIAAEKELIFKCIPNKVLVILKKAYIKCKYSKFEGEKT